MKQKMFGIVLFMMHVVFCADYHWTGAAGDCKWSNPGNWETATGEAVTAVETGAVHTYNFGERYDADSKALVKTGWGANLASWQADLPNARDVRFVLSADGKTVQMKIVSHFLMLIR